MRYYSHYEKANSYFFASRLYESECQYRCFDASLTRETQWEIGKNNGCFASGCNASRRRESDSKEQWDFDD